MIRTYLKVAAMILLPVFSISMNSVCYAVDRPCDKTRYGDEAKPGCTTGTLYFQKGDTVYYSVSIINYWSDDSEGDSYEEGEDLHEGVLRVKRNGTTYWGLSVEIDDHNQGTGSFKAPIGGHYKLSLYSDRGYPFFTNYIEIKAILSNERL